MALLSLKNISFKYPQSEKHALRNISLEIEHGDYIAVLGRNGSGKTTLARVLAGFFECEGEIETPEDFFPGIVFQQPKEQIIAGVVERDTAFGPQNMNFSKEEIEQRTIECLSVVELLHKSFSRTMDLSLGQTQRVAFAGILAMFPDFLILDEVTAMLDPQAKQNLMEFVGQWNQKHKTIFHVTHDEDEALAAGKILVLEKGEVAFWGTKDDFVKQRDLYESIFSPGLNSMNFQKEIDSSKEDVLSVENLSFEYGGEKIFENLSFSLKKGTMTALTGPSGCGKSTLFECLAGLKKTSGGRICAVSRPSLCLQENEAALFEPYAADDVAFGPKNRGLSGKELVSRVKNSMELSFLPFDEFADRGTFSLSGGEKRKLSVAGIIALDSDIMIFDEPTSALDTESRKNILLTLRKLADSGKTILFSTHRMNEVNFADCEMKWSDIQKNSAAGPQKGMDGSLPELKPVENAGILDSLAKTAAGFASPPHIPASFVSALPPVIKFVIFAVLCFAGVSCNSYSECLAVVGISLLYAVLAKFPMKNALAAIRKILPWILLFSVMGIILLPMPESDPVYFSWKIFKITRTKINFVVSALFHAVSLILSMGTFVFSTKEHEIMDGFAAVLKPLALLKVPVRYAVLVLGIIFRFIPLLVDELTSILKTQIVRGAFGSAKGFGKIRVFVSIFVPVILQTFRKSQFLADSLTARNFK